MAHSLVSMILAKVIVTVMVIVLFSLGVSSKPRCVGACSQFPDCAAYCKTKGYQTGTCTLDVCCCAKAVEHIFS
ncbi:hypothetical protein AAZX31_10G118600 [Glycine max]|uniref:Knottin scorpion toxin-like domain-containing protein n=2 Tax=Glycine subgen. Soja TaxID=1462606 RepID=K7LJ10_SOYBN|nr:hypothetical protein JHK87_027838 [Glycine soja]KAG4997159.1 hypothetical protein JHK85_028598 [Glycine max]KAG5003922.1 hypothetical protein JHK86_028061 [Glycine max]KAG5127098.1 hypothetical protein JHK82_027933 [Glycine max]KAG5151711.1 hypothetical protein JHK84_028183 [Glycine max]